MENIPSNHSAHLNPAFHLPAPAHCAGVKSNYANYANHVNDIIMHIINIPFIIGIININIQFILEDPGWFPDLTQVSTA